MALVGIADIVPRAHPSEDPRSLGRRDQALRAYVHPALWGQVGPVLERGGLFLIQGVEGAVEPLDPFPDRGFWLCETDYLDKRVFEGRLCGLN